MSRWSWNATEAPRPGVDVFEINCDSTRVGRIEIERRGVDPVPGVVAFCETLTGASALRRSPENGPDPDSPSTLRQQADLHIRLAALRPSYRERAARLTAIAAFLGREITSTKDLTHDEAERVLVAVEEAHARRGRAA